MKRQNVTSPWDKRAVGERLRAFRIAKGWSAVLLATMVEDLTSQKITNYEKGRDLLPVEIAGPLCGVTGLNFEYLYHGKMDNLPADLAGKIAKVLAGEMPPKPKRAARQG